MEVATVAELTPATIAWLLEVSARVPRERSGKTAQDAPKTGQEAPVRRL